jgi:hypothetical protein
VELSPGAGRKGGITAMTSTEKDRPYRELQQRFAAHPIGAPPTDTFMEILKFYYEPEEAHLAAHMRWDLEPE